MFDGIYCINLEVAKERRELMQKQFNNVNEFKFIQAASYDDNNVKEIVFNRKVKNNKKHIKFLSQIAITCSHLKCWKEILEKKNTFGCIIEDDIKLIPNYKSHFNIALTKEIINYMKTKPTILWLTGLSSLKFKDKKKYSFETIGPQYGNCMYVINHQLAKILITNMYPITEPCDDYIKNLVRKQKISNYSITPPIAYDLSSDYYQKFWTPEDILIKKHMQRLSAVILYDTFLNNNNDKMNRTIKIGTHSSVNKLALLPFLLTNTSYNLVSHDYNKFNICVGTIYSEYLNNETIICGGGFRSNKDQVKGLFYATLVRGPLSKRVLEQNGYKVDNVGAPLLILSQIYTPKKIQEYPYLFVVSEDDSKLLLERNSKLNCIQIKSIDKSLIDNITSCSKVYTNQLNVIMICHSYNIPVVWFSCTVLSSSYNFEFDDYYQSLGIYNITPVGIDLRNGMNDESFVQPTREKIKHIQSVVTENLIFYNELINNVK